MKLLIVGSREIEDFDLEKHIPENTELIISGGARGVDSIAEKYADKRKISKLILRPDYKRYGKAAPLIRNKCMVELADALLIIWDGKSSGTKFTLEYAQSLKKKVILININDNN